MNLLLDSRPLIVIPELAELLGDVDQAIILQQIHYWLQKSSNKIDGHVWVYNSMTEWQKQFPWIKSRKSLANKFKKLEDRGLLITGNYNQAGFDKTKWYSIDYSTLSHLGNALGNSYPTIGSKLPNGMGKNYPTYTSRLPETTTEITNGGGATAKPISEIFALWQECFGTPSPMILTDLQDDLNEWGFDILEHAITWMAKAGVSYSRPYPYLNKVLKKYRDHGVETLEQAKAFDEKYQEELAAKANSHAKNKPLTHKKAKGYAF
ncbi:DnaD domain protein [Limosilactobacillus gastricus]|uniref:DnaD domain protein n=1 Tax=Limosilactobacillus gastricus TaxID=227942 RepID=UPI0026EFAE04|nr:DnaD domain protein [Limosilactobacillus gastricus]